MSTTTLSLLLPDIGGGAETIHAAVLGVESASTTYSLGCPDPVAPEDCGMNDVTLTLGPWADKTAAPGADKTGVLGIEGKLEQETGEPGTFSLHCDMSGTHPLGCTQTNSGLGMGHYTTSITASSDLGEFDIFTYSAVTVTSGAEKLTQTETGSKTEKTATGDEGGDAGPGESQTGDAGNAEETEGSEDASSSMLPRMLAVVAAAGLSALWML